MHRLIFISIILTTCLNQGISQHKLYSDGVRLGYIDSLNSVLNILRYKGNLKLGSVEFVLPMTEQEAQIFYGSDYNKESSKEFRKLLECIDDYCIKGNQTLMDRFILLSNFVDGYFADDYFDSAKKIYRKNPNVFCSVYHNVAEGKKKRLIGYGGFCN